MRRFFEKISENAPSVDPSYRIGMRVVKTVAAVTICLVVAWLIGSRDSLPIAAIAAIVTMQVTRSDTLRIGIFRVLGTLIGGVFGVLAVFIGSMLPFPLAAQFIVIIPIMLLINLYVCNLLRMQDSCSISCVVIIIIASHLTMDATYYELVLLALIRLRDTMIGVVIATLINMLPNFIRWCLRIERKCTDET
ncbi:MAG: aromatic acid exporter family protein [Oscillospiraceae bacterium]|nr:aromatic acid exporter family protein [Oscillospiraceae bacterium]